ncbi:hypothetical protein C0992_012177 [Termitomyces sp. T32_za158]|nr:hypothetical protein C0992_012177 [Termitomyces sp. T32_za158]
MVEQEANPVPELYIVGEVTDNDNESSEEDQDNLQEVESEVNDQLNDQLCEETDNGNDTDALVKGLGFSKADFLEKWKKISKATHDSVEWRKDHPNPCGKCKNTPCEFANSGTLSCIKCKKQRTVCTVRIDYIADKMAQLSGSQSQKWISRAVARNWHRDRRVKIAGRPNITGPTLVKSSPKEFKQFPFTLQYPDSGTHASTFAKASEPVAGRSLTLPWAEVGESTNRVPEVKDQSQKAHERYDAKWATLSNYGQQRRKIGGEIWDSEQRIAQGHNQLGKETRRYGYERPQEVVSPYNVNCTMTTNDSDDESGIPPLFLVGDMMKAAEKERASVEICTESQTLRMQKSVGTKEKNGSKSETKAVELIEKEKHRSLKEMVGLAETKRRREEENTINIAKKMKEAEKAVDGARKRLKTITFTMGGVKAGSAQGGNGTSHTRKRKDAGPLYSQLQDSSLSRRMKDPRQMKIRNVEALEKDRSRLKYPIESKPVDSSIAWWRSAALFNQLQINRKLFSSYSDRQANYRSVMEHARFTLSRGLAEYLERLKSLRDQTTSSPELDPLLRHELNVITESLASLHGNEQSSDIRQSRNRLLFPDKHYLESDAEALERQIRRFEEIRHDTRDSEASRVFSRDVFLRFQARSNCKRLAHNKPSPATTLTDEHQDSTSTSSCSQLKLQRRRVNLTLADIELAKTVLDNPTLQHAEQLSSLRSGAPLPSPSPDSKSSPNPEFFVSSPKSMYPPSSDHYRAGSESSVPSLSACSSASAETQSPSLPVTPSSSHHEEYFSCRQSPASSFQPAVIKPLVITKHNGPAASRRRVSSTLPTKLAPKCPLPPPPMPQDDSEYESDSEWYLRELSQVITLPPSALPDLPPKARPDSMCISENLAPSPFPSTPARICSSPKSRPSIRRNHSSIARHPPPSVPLSPKRVPMTHSSTRTSISRSNVLPFVSLRRPPPRSSIPADCVFVDDTFTFSDDSDSEFSLSLYDHSPLPSIRLNSPKSAYSQRSFQSPCPSPFPPSFPSTPSSAHPFSIEEEFDFPVEEIQFDMKSDRPAMPFLDVPTSPLDLEVDLASNAQSFSASGASTNELSSSHACREPGARDNARELRSRWSSSTLGSVPGEQSRRSAIGVALRAYFASPSAKPKTHSSPSSRCSGSDPIPKIPTSMARRHKESDVMVIGYGHGV